MPSLGPLEILVIFIVALLVFGPNKLPELARQVGKGLAEFRRVQHHLRNELDDAIHSVMDDDKPRVPPVVTEPPAEVADAVLPAAAPRADADPAEVPPPASVDPAAGPGPDVDTTAGEPRTGERGPTPPPLADDA